MKPQIHARPGLNAAIPPGQRADGARPNATKTFEHRYERRKIREQLRRMAWVLNAEDQILA